MNYTDFGRFIESEPAKAFEFEPIWPELPKGETAEGQAITEQWIEARREWNEQ